jgi:hypothetical protein
VLNCNTVAYNAGCGVKLTEDKKSFGPGFNSIGGGWCVTGPEAYFQYSCGLQVLLQVCYGTHTSLYQGLVLGEK